MADLTMGQRIAEERKRLGISQEALGEKVGVSRQAISKWESDGAVPEIDKLIALSKLFGVSVGWLLGVEETSMEIPEESAPQEPEAPAVREPTLWLAILAYLKTLPGLRKLGILLLIVVQLLMCWRIIWCYNAANQARTFAHRAEQATDRLEMEVEALKAAIEEKEAAGPGTLLSGYSFDTVLEKEEMKATVTFSAVPYSWQEGDTGYLCVNGKGVTPLQIPCQWDGAFLICAAVLNLTDGFELCFAVEHADGSRQLQMLSDAYLENAEFAQPPTIIGSVGSAQYDPEKKELLLKELKVNYQRSEKYTDTAVTWQTMAVILLVDGQESTRYALFDANVRQDSTLTGGGSGITSSEKVLENVELKEGQQVELVAYADFSNGISAQETIGRWTVEADGVLTPILD